MIFDNYPKGDRLWPLAYVAQFKNSRFHCLAEVVFSLGLNFDNASMSNSKVLPFRTSTRENSLPMLTLALFSGRIGFAVGEIWQMQ